MARDPKVLLSTCCGAEVSLLVSRRLGLGPECSLGNWDHVGVVGFLSLADTAPVETNDTDSNEVELENYWKNEHFQIPEYRVCKRG